MENCPAVWEANHLCRALSRAPPDIGTPQETGSQTTVHTGHHHLTSVSCSGHWLLCNRQSHPNVSGLKYQFVAPHVSWEVGQEIKQGPVQLFVFVPRGLGLRWEWREWHGWRIDAGWPLGNCQELLGRFPGSSFKASLKAGRGFQEHW